MVSNVSSPAVPVTPELPIHARPDALPIANAAIHHMKGDFAAALQCLTAVGPELETADLMRARGYVQIELKDFSGAARSYESATQKEQNSVENWFQWGFCLHKEGRFADALQKFEKAVALGGTWIEIPLATAICQLSLKKYAEAVAASDACLAHDAKYLPALFAKGVALHLTWELDKASQVYLSILEHSAAHVPALMNLITAAMQQKKYADVQRYSALLVGVDPNNVLAIEGLAISAFTSGNYEEARDHFKRLTELAPNQGEHWLNLGIAWRKIGAFPEAIEALAKATQVRPDSLQAHTQLCDSLWRSGNLADARSSFEVAVRKWPDREELTLSLSYVLEQIGERTGAEAVCSEFCGRHPENAPVRFRLGCLKWQREDIKGSLESFSKCVELRPAWLEAEINLGLAYLADRDLDPAEKVFQLILQREQENVDALKGLATVALSRKQDEPALKLHQRLLELGEATADVYFNCGVLAQRLNMLKEAADYYREALKIRGEFPEALLNLGHTLKSVGEGEEAKNFWIPALELQPEFALNYFSRK